MNIDPLRLRWLALAFALIGLLLLTPVFCRGADIRVANYRAILPCTFVVGYTGSMKPFIKGGETLIVYRSPYSSLKAGDLVVRLDAWMDTARCHRIIRNEGTLSMPRWVTQGDACIHPDPGWMTEEKYVGKWDVLP